MTCSLCPAKASQKGDRVAPTARHQNTTRCRWDSRMLQQLHVGTRTLWKSQIMPRSSEAKSNTHRTSQKMTHNDILPKLNNAQCLSLIDVSFGYHNLKLDKRSSYLTTFACQFGRYRYKWLPFGAAPAGDRFQWKIDERCKDLPVSA